MVIAWHCQLIYEDYKTNVGLIQVTLTQLLNVLLPTTTEALDCTAMASLSRWLFIQGRIRSVAPEPNINGRNKWLHPTISVGCNYLFLPLISALNATLLISGAIYLLYLLKIARIYWPRIYVYVCVYPILTSDRVGAIIWTHEHLSE